MAERTLSLHAAEYPIEALEAAARALGPRARVRLRRAGARFSVTLPSAAEGPFLSEALAHVHRLQLMRLHGPLTAPAIAWALEKGFYAQARDPLEEMLDSVGGERRAAVQRLLERAREGR